MTDIREPSFYFEERNRRRKQIHDIKIRLDELLVHLQSLKEKKGVTPAYKTIVENELKRVKKKRIDQSRKMSAKVIVDKIIDDEESDAVDLMKEELDLRAFKKIEPDFISTGNIGCMTQISTGTRIPIIHTVELLDWFTGGPKPYKLKDF